MGTLKLNWKGRGIGNIEIGWGWGIGSIEIGWGWGGGVGDVGNGLEWGYEIELR